MFTKIALEIKPPFISPLVFPMDFSLVGLELLLVSVKEPWTHWHPESYSKVTIERFQFCHDKVTQDIQRVWPNFCSNPDCWTWQYPTRKTRPAHLIGSINTWSLTLEGSLKKKKKSPSDGWTGSAGGRDDELQSEASSGAVINGVLPETSAAPLSIIIRVEEPSGGMTVSVVRSLAVGGCLLRFSSPHFCQYTIEAIAGRVGALWQWRRSPTIIHQWFPPAAGQCVVGFLHCASGSGALQRQVYWFCWDFGMVLPDFQQRHLYGERANRKSGFLAVSFFD